MQLQISVEQLRKNKLFIATPMYGGMCLGMYMKACLDLQGICGQYGMENRFSFIFNESLITRARNYLVDEFLRARSVRPNPAFDPKAPEGPNNPKNIEEPFTHLLFIDADIHFDPRDVIGCMALDKDVIGAPYPKKSIKWNSVLTAMKRNAEQRAAAIAKNLELAPLIAAAEAQNATINAAVEPGQEAKIQIEVPKLVEVPKEITTQDLEMVTGDYVFNAVAGTGQFNVGEPLKVMEIGTGFIMIKREVFLKWQEQYPQYAYKPDHVGQQHFDGSRYIHAFFDCIIDRKREITIVNDLGVHKKGDVVEIGGSERYLSEDYFFCQQWRNMGGEIWLCPWMRTFHVGTYAFQGNMAAVAQFVGQL